MLDSDFQRKFLSKSFTGDPQMGILTQSQINFLEKSNFQNYFNQYMLTPGEKEHIFFFKN